MNIISIYSQLYWLTRLDYLRGFFTALVVLCVISIFVWGAATSEDDGVTSERIAKYTKRFLFVTLPIAILGLTFCPTTNEAVFIIAGGKTINFVQSDSSINKIPKQTTKLVTDFLQQQIDKLDK